MSEHSISGAEAAKLARSLTDSERERIIDASPNVVGFDRFRDVAHSVALAHGYKVPK